MVRWLVVTSQREGSGFKPCQLAGGLLVWSFARSSRDCMGFRQVLLSSPKDMQVGLTGDLKFPVCVNVGMLSVSMCQP